jgi:hypothetical protein
MVMAGRNRPKISPRIGFSKLLMSRNPEDSGAKLE